MDYNDDFSSRNLEQGMTGIKQPQQCDKEDSENLLVGNLQHAFLEENANNEWRPLNGLRSQGMYNCQDQEQQPYDEHDTDYHTVYNDNVSSSHILNSNRQNMESVLRKNLLINLCTH